MILTALKSKLHRGWVTHAEIDYDGSLAVDADLLRAANIHMHEQLHVYNLSNGERFITYAITAEAGSGMISANGAAAHKALVGHEVIICTYCALDEQALSKHQPLLVYLNQENQITKTTN